jgi:hypothetical protein
MLGFKSQGLANSNEGETNVTNSSTGLVAAVMEILANQQLPQAGSPC